jgi:hypothetical protein
MSDDIDITEYGFDETDKKSIKLAILNGANNLKIDEDDFEIMVNDYLENSIFWLLTHPNLKTNTDGSFDKGLRYITCQIAVNMFNLLDVNQTDTVMNTEYNVSIPLSKAEIITPNIVNLLAPYLNTEGSISALSLGGRDFGF